ncbi:MAG: hypothetical protein AAF573_22465 [Bacteroidota bacterium]
MKKIFAFVVVLFFTAEVGFAQTLLLDDVEKIEFQNKGDYDKFEDKILKYIDWLETHSLNHEDRRGVNILMFKWVEGTSSVMVTMYPFVMDYVKKNPDFMTLYLAGWTKYSLNHPDDKDELSSSLAAVNTLLDYYKKGATFGVKKDKKLEKLLKKRASGKLEKYIAKRIR